MLARRLLTRSAAARRILHDRYQRVLLDEFQDTDPIQLEIAILMTSPPDSSPPTAHPVPGRLFVVGDPKQSIYRFRRADIAVYLGAAARVDAEEVALSANFRSTGAVIDWVNGVFADVIRPEPDVQPAYRALEVARAGSTVHGTVTVLGVDVHDPGLDADALRWCEAGDVAAAVATALHEGWPVGDGDGGLRPCRPGDIAVLLPARTSLPMLERSLADLDVPYRAENASVVYLAPEIRHVMLALRAAADPTDELALVAALRSPLYGCSDVDLYDWRRAGGRWNLFAAAPAEADGGPVADGLAHLRTIAERAARLGPADLVDALVVERRVLEVALAGPDARDVWRRVRYVVDQARAWTEAGGRGLRRYLRWTRFQASEGRASDTILPERDHDAVRIMTVHAAKGLEFPITVVAGLTTRNQGRRSMSVVWPAGTWTLAERDNPLFESFQPLDEQMGDAERRRLLYVACTRAVDHLVVSLHRKPESRVQGARHPHVDQRLRAGDRRRRRPRRHRVRGFGGAAGPDAGGAAGAAVGRSDGVGRGTRPGRAGRDGALDDERHPSRRRHADRRSPTTSRRCRTRRRWRWPTTPTSSPSPSTPAWPRTPSTSTCRRGSAGATAPPSGAPSTPCSRTPTSTTATTSTTSPPPTPPPRASSASSRRSPPSAARPSGRRSSGPSPAAPTTGGSCSSSPSSASTVVEGYIDLLVRTPDGLVIVDYKTDHFGREGDRVERLARYRFQLAAYGLALGQVLDEPVVGGILVHCRPDGPAEQLDVPDWPGALAAVRTPVLH